MNEEKRICQNCKQSFVIESEDFAFYEKIKVPPPTFCPECRFQRRLAFSNIFNLYRRKCDLCKKEAISVYAPEALYTVYCPPCWYSDQWDPASFGRDYDFSRPFFEQYDELLHTVPLMGLSTDLQSVNDSPYNSFCGHLKNAYLLFFADFVENSGYGFYCFSNKDTYDCSLASSCEFCYDCRNSFKNGYSVGVENTIETLESAFLRDSRNCQNCFGSANLRNKKYHIFNEPYSEETYREEMKNWDLGSYKIYQEAKEKARESWKSYPPRPRYDDQSIDSTGNYVFESRNCKECYEVTGVENSKYVFMVLEAPLRDSYDISGWGNNMQLSYECSIVGENVSDIKFSHDTGIGMYSAEYCKLSLGGSHHFGCVSMRKGDYYIFNKKYSPEEYDKMREKIIEQMNTMPYKDVQGRIYKYGEFFPIELSPHGYNETLAQDFFPLSQEAIKVAGYKYQDIKISSHPNGLKATELPDHIKDATDGILNEVILCQKCPRGFKIIPAELAFLRKMNVPLPRECPQCRIQEKFSQWIKQLRLVERVCAKCQDVFQTPYTEKDYPIAWCKKCYQEEVI